MGLQQDCSSSLNTPDEALLERHKCFWTLYFLDKKRVFLTGRPCSIYLFDSDTNLPKCDLNTLPNQIRTSHLHMTSIWEQSYIKLYSPRSLRQNADTRNDQSAQLHELCREWVSQYESLLSKPSQQEDMTVTCLRLELRFCYFVTLVLILRCNNKFDSRKQVIEYSRSALRIITSVHHTGTSIQGIGLLGK